MTDVAPIRLDPDPYEPFRLSQGFRVGDLLLISGQAAIDENGGLVGVGDFDAQAEQVFRNLQRVLEAGGSGLDRVVKVTIFLTDMANFPKIVELRGKWFTPPYPADTIVEVTSLALPGAGDRDRGDRRRGLSQAGRALLEDVERDERGDERVRDVDDLGEVEVDARRAEAVGAPDGRGRAPPRASRSSRAGRRAPPASGPSRRPRGSRSSRSAARAGLRRRHVGREARHPPRRLAKAEPDRHRRVDLDPRAADLAVALREVDVAEREQRAGYVHRQEQRRAGDEPADVEVAAGLAGRDRPQAPAALGGMADSGAASGDRAAAARIRSSRSRCASISACDGATPITPAWTHAGHRDAR